MQTSPADLEQILQLGRLPRDSAAIDGLRKGLIRIAGDYSAWAIIQQQFSDRELAKRFTQISRLSDEFVGLLTDDPQLQLASILGGKWPGRAEVDLDRLREMHDTVSAIATLHAKVYDEGSRKRPRRTEPEDWLFRQLYDLATKISGRPPNIAAPLYRYTIGSAKLLGIDLRHIGEQAFIKRAQGLGLRQPQPVPTSSTAAPQSELDDHEQFAARIQVSKLPAPELDTIPQFAARANMGERTVAKKVADGEIPSIKIGRSRRIDPIRGMAAIRGERPAPEPVRRGRRRR